MADVVVGIGGDITDLQRKTRQSEQTLTSFAGKVTGSVRGQFSALGDSIAGAFAAGAVIGKIKSTLDHFGAVQDMADRLATSAESIQRLDLMGAGSGAGAEDLVNSLTKINRALGDVENTPARAAFQRLGLDMQKLASASPENQILMLADAFQSAQAKGQGFAEIYDLLGKSASNIIPVLRQSRASLEELAATPVMSDDQVARLDEVGDKLTLLSQKLTVSIGGGMAGLGVLIEDMGTAIGEKWAYIGHLFDNLKAGDSLGVAARKAAEFRDALHEAGKAADTVRKPIAPPIVKVQEGMSKDEARASADKIAGRRTLAEELVLLQAKATGNQRIIEQVTRELNLRHRTAQIMRESGVSHRQALAVATQMQALEDKAERAANRRAGIPNKIHGAHSRGFSGLMDRSGAGQGSLTDTFTFAGLDRFDALQQRIPMKDRDRVIGGKRKIPFGHAFDQLHKPLGAAADQAASDRDRAQAMGGPRIVEELMKQIVENTKALAHLD